MDEAGFFDAGDDFDGNARRQCYTAEQLVLIPGIPDGAGGNGARAHNVMPFDDRAEPFQNAAEVIHRLLADRPFAEDAGPQAGDFALRSEGARRPAGFHFRYSQPDRVATNIDRGITRHLHP